MNELDIAEVAKRSGLAASALRYYEEQGLIHSIGRRGLRRQYHPSVLQTLAIIKLGRQAGLQLTEISAMFNAQGQMQIDRQRLAAKATEIDNTIRRLSAVRDGLRHVVTCPASDHLSCPSFQRMLKLLPE